MILPPTGKSVEIEVIHIDYLAGDRIVYHWGQGNQSKMMQQLGIVFIPGLSVFTS
jgi:predicted ester cyclase